MFAFVSTAAAALAELKHAPPDTVWILSAAAGTMMGSFASTLAYANLSHSQRMARIAVSFCAGLLAAPYAAGQIPRPETVPLALHVFSVSGLCAFVAWSFVRAAQKRMGGIADSLIDRVTTPKQARDKRRTDNDQAGRVRLVPLVLLAGLAVLAWFCRDILFLLYIMATGGFGH